MSAPSAWQVQQALSAVHAFSDRLRADTGENDHATLLAALEDETDALDILRRVIRSALEDKAMATTAADRIKVLSERKARYEHRSEAARGLAFAMMDALGLPKLEDPEFTASIGKPRQQVTVTDINALPAEMVRTTRAPDMAAIKEALKVGEVPPGIELGNGLPVLTIRVR